MRAFAVIGIIALLSRGGFAQSAESRPEFEAADVHAAPQTAQRFMRGGELHGARYEVHNASMVDLVSTAYGVDPDKVLDGPSWLEMDRFDVIALAPARTPPETLKLMLQALLADRFKLVARQETRPMPAFALTVGKRLLMKESDGSGEPGCKNSIKTNGGPNTDGPIVLANATLTLTCRNMTVSSLLNELPIPRRSGDQNRPIVDQTGLKGAWNFDFEFTLSGPLDLAPIADALEKQLGLKLETVNLPMPVVEVRSVNQKPTPNSPEALKAFPATPAEFDVAEIKPNKSDDNSGPIIMAKGGAVVRVAGRGGRGGPAQLQNGRLNLQGYTLQNLIMLAWDLPNSDRLVGAPKWLNSDRFDVIAKVPGGPAVDAFSDMDSIKPLLRTLLLQRFQMKVHEEEQPLSGYVLTAAKPKLKKADPASRTKWINGVAPDAKDPRPGNNPLGRLVTCQNMTMAQFAELLPNIAPGYFPGSTVVDATGLEGGWDFVFYFSAAGADGGRGLRIAGLGAPAGGGSDAGATDPSGALSLFDALNKLLGLKLEPQKRPVSVLVLDHVEQKLADN